jgi:hypothetical protein
MTGGVVNKLIATKFSRTTYMISTIAMKPMSSLTNKGETVEKPYFPFKLIFRPNEVLKNAYSDIAYPLSFKQIILIFILILTIKKFL